MREESVHYYYDEFKKRNQEYQDIRDNQLYTPICSVLDSTFSGAVFRAVAG